MRQGHRAGGHREGTERSALTHACALVSLQEGHMKTGVGQWARSTHLCADLSARCSPTLMHAQCSQGVRHTLPTFLVCGWCKLSTTTCRRQVLQQLPQLEHSWLNTAGVSTAGVNAPLHHRARPAHEEPM